jgi:hypothetical protein
MTMDRRTALALMTLAPTAVVAAPGLDAQPTPRPAMDRCCPIVELRQYTLHAGQRDVLIDLFEREFVAPQNAVGARLIGQFVDLDDPDRFVWMRGFESMAARAHALAAFYDGPIWKAHRAAANATIVDSDNVLLLRPLQPGGGFEPSPTAAAGTGLLTASIHYLEPKSAAAFAAFFESHLLPMLEAQGAAVLATFVSESSANTFPRLPIRIDAPVLIWFARFADEQAQRHCFDRMHADTAWRAAVPEALLPAFMRKPEVLRLLPTAQSPLR